MPSSLHSEYLPGHGTDNLDQLVCWRLRGGLLHRLSFQSVGLVSADLCHVLPPTENQGCVPEMQPRE